MPRICYVPKKFGFDALEIIEKANEVAWLSVIAGTSVAATTVEAPPSSRTNVAQVVASICFVLIIFPSF